MSNTAKRKFFFVSQNGKCAYCSTEMTMQLNKPNTCTLDHIIPKSQGGPSTIFNLLGVCFRCNNLKNDMPVVMFLKLLPENVVRAPSL
jgi:5-methylcytosine-specific restriction endonuclease McrA